MCVAENDPNDRSQTNAITRLPEAFERSALEVPSLDEILADPEVSRRIGKIIADAARQASRLKAD
jgi:hypothetical protein